MIRSVRVCWDISWHVTVWGLAGGAALGALYGPLSLFLRLLFAALGLEASGYTGTENLFTVFIPAAVLIGAWLGGITGLLTGLVDGLVLSTIDALRARSLYLASADNHVLSIVSAAIGGLCSFLLFMVEGP